MSVQESKSYECCIIGAGPAGLGAALELVKHGITDIAIIDKNPVPGGLARTQTFDGVKFDIGPHRFFTKNKEVNTIWHDVLGSDFKPVNRLTRIFYQNKYLHYPIKPLEIAMNINPLDLIASIASFAAVQLCKNKTIVSFEDWAVQNFGYKLYTMFFKTYTEKVWGIPCAQIGAEWAAQRIKGLNAAELFKRIFSKKKSTTVRTLIEQFDYPVHGAGQMYTALCDIVCAKGAHLFLNSNVEQVNCTNEHIDSIDIVDSKAQQKPIRAKYFFSSIPLVDFFRMLYPVYGPIDQELCMHLNYRDHITVNMLVDREVVFPDQWIYVHDARVSMARVANYNNFSAAMCTRNNKTALSVEYFASKNQGLWNESDQALAALAADELQEMKLLRRADIGKSWVIRELCAYPSWYLGFQPHYEHMKTRLNSFLNVAFIGRAGLHRYNNQDHSLMSGMLSARNYLKLPGSPYNLYNINSDAQYLESSSRDSI